MFFVKACVFLCFLLLLVEEGRCGGDECGCSCNCGPKIRIKKPSKQGPPPTPTHPPTGSPTGTPTMMPTTTEPCEKAPNVESEACGEGLREVADCCCLRVEKEMKTWADAEADCAAVGGGDKSHHLNPILNPFQMNYTIGVINQECGPDGDYWINARWNVTNTKWEFHNGFAIDFADGMLADGQDGDCAAMNTVSEELFIAACDEMKMFVCFLEILDEQS